MLRCVSVLDSVETDLVHDERGEGARLFIHGARDLGCKVSEVVEALVTEPMNDRPIGVLIGMRSDIPKTDGDLHRPCKRFIDDLRFGQRVKSTARRLGRWKR